MANLLSKYQEKRHFKVTSEPRGKVHAKSKSRFVIQRHEASRLHYDLRLELDGVLKSWALPKEPIFDPSIKRLAVQTEDHPVEYLTFKGDIPEGEYGAGHMEIWDTGTWKSLDPDPQEAFEKGKMAFELKGKVMKGRWRLIRTRGFGNAKSSWLFFKSHDEFAVESGEEPSRAKTAKTKKKTVKKSPAAFVEPQLATLVDRPPEGKDWVFESKFDGYRILGTIGGGKAKLLTRKGNDWSHRFGALQEALAGLPVTSALIDGELVALDKKGVSQFQELQNSLIDPEKSAKLVYYAFDLLEMNGEDLRPLPLLERKKRLAVLVKVHDDERIRLSEHTVGNGEKAFAKACKLGLEGVIAKRAKGPYRSGRHDEWLKIKCAQRQEFVIAGFTKPKGKRTHLGALLLATRDESGLRYVGKVGTGFNAEILKDLSGKLTKLKARKSPFSEDVREKDVTWVRPELVAEISFGGWTNDLILRHPSFEGLREDKGGSDVVIERPRSIEKIEAPTKGIVVTHPERIVYPEGKITKGEIAAYYELVAERMLPFVQDRPMSVKRCPRGQEEVCFFQQQFKPGLGEGVESVAVGKSAKDRTRMQVVSPAGILSLVQNGVLEMHVWGSRSANIENPDSLIFDFDPDPTTTWKEVVQGTKLLKKVLEEMGLKTFLKVSGGKGVHIHAPILPKSDWDEVHAFAAYVAKEMERRKPDTYTASSLKSERKDRIYLDYVRNSRGVTSVAPYSTRARPGAPVAAPIHWDELTAKLKPDAFNVRNMEKRLAKIEDPWADYFKSARALPELE